MTDRPPLVRWGLSLLAVVAALAVRWALTPWLGDRAPYLLFSLAVLVAAHLGGLGPGLAATLVAGLVGLAVFVGLPPPAAGDWVLLAVFLMVGVAISGVAETARRA